MENEPRGLPVDPCASRRPVWIRRAPRDKPTMRCEEGLRCHSKAGPGRAGEEVAQGGKERTFSRLEGRPLHLALEHGHFVAQGEQLDLLGVVTASHEDHQLRTDGERRGIRRPRADYGPVRLPRITRKVSATGVDEKSSCSMGDQVFGALRALFLPGDDVAEHQGARMLEVAGGGEKCEPAF